MKNLIKNLLVLIFLSAAVTTGLTSCVKNGSNASSSENTGSAANKDTGESLEVSAETAKQTLTEPNGNTFSLQDYKGKVVLINFWATWCKPCREEMPGLVKIQDEFKNKDFEIVGVNADEEESAEMIQMFAEKMSLNYKIAKADPQFFQSFLDISKAGAIPQSFLLNRDGRVVAGWVGGGQKTVADIKKSVGKLVEN